MKPEDIQKPLTEPELAQAVYALQCTGYDVVLRRLAFERDLLKERNETHVQQCEAMRKDLELVLSHLQWCNVNAGQAYVLRGVPYSHLLYWPLEYLKRKEQQ